MLVESPVDTNAVVNKTLIVDGSLFITLLFESGAGNCNYYESKF